MSKQATLYRMVLPDHVCPYGERAKAMLEDAGFEVDDRLLTSREEVDTFKADHELTTTPLIVIDGEPIGGSQELATFLSEHSQ
jgi:glutaredoxin 3